MEFSNKKLQKAFEYCENGKYKEALKLCSKVLNKEYNNEEALTLEGEILYKAGRIDDAIITWKINAEYNKNALAQRHLDSLDTNVKQMALSYTSIYSENEEYRRLVIDAYNESTNKNKDNTSNVSTDKSPSETTTESKIDTPTEINEVKAQPINEKIKEESKVVEVKKEEPKVVEVTKEEPKVVEVIKEEPKVVEVIKEEPKVVEVIKEEPKVVEVTKEEPKVVEVIKEDPKVVEVIKEDPKVVEVTKEDPKVVEVTKEEPKVAEVKKEDSTFERISVANRRGSSVTRNNGFNKKIIAVIVAAVIIVAGGFGIYKASSSKPKATENTHKTETQVQTPPKVDWSNFNTDMQNAINSQNYNDMYTLLTKAPENEVPQAEMGEYQAGLKAMQANGVQYFYNQGMNDFGAKNYNQAIDLFQKGLKFANGNYLAPHLTYHIGASYSGLGEHDKAVEYYKLYLKNFPNSNIYNSGCLYVLAKYYFSQGHVKEAQQYAQELQNQFPNSLYNNNDIANILANK